MATEELPGVYVVRAPDASPLPLIFDSPHSGFEFPPDFRPAASREALLTSADRFVDELWSAAPSCGATLVAALFPRAYVDPNRDRRDVDPDLVEGGAGGAERMSDYSRRGMGLIRRDVLPGIPLYDRKLTPQEVEHRLKAYYQPYRTRLRSAIESAASTFGTVWHVNCHSMKPTGNAMNTDPGRERADFVLGDRGGRTCAPEFTAWVQGELKRRGYSVWINDPYQGGDLVATFGDPARKRHSLQIEVNRALYLDSQTCEKNAGFDALARELDGFTAALAERVRELLRELDR